MHVIDSLGAGGAEHNLVNLLVASDRAAFEHHVVGLYRDDALAGQLRAAGVTVTLLSGSGPLAALKLVRPLASVVRRFDPHVVHTQLVMSDLVGRLAVSMGVARPMLSTLQNRPYDSEAVVSEFSSHPLASAIRLADRWLGNWTKTRYLAVSESVRASYIRELGIAPERIEVLYNSIDLSKFQGEPLSRAERAARRTRLGLVDAPLLLNVARHNPQKGLLDLIAAVASPRLRATGARLLLVGSGPHTPLIRERVQALGLEAEVSLLGRRSDVRELMAVSDIFVLPSIYEGLPLALLEALAMGMPVVASDLQEIREVTRDTGAEFVPPGRSELLANAITALILEPARASALARQGRHNVEERFDVRKNVRLFEDMLRRTARGTGGVDPIP